MINATLKKTLLNVYGEEGEAWIENFPAILSSLKGRWNFTVNAEYPNLSYHYVAHIQLNTQREAVLKCGVPNPASNTEIVALKKFNGQGVVQLLQYDASVAAMLLERILPGETLREAEEEKSIHAFAKIASALHQPIKNTGIFPTVETWFESFEKMEPFHPKLIDYALGIGKELIDSMGERVLLHGDLHHDNILNASSTRGTWLAIDPKGVVGEREYEVGAFMRNPVSTLMCEEDPKKIMTKRLDMLSELTGLDKKRLWAWSFSQAVLAAWWSLEDKEEEAFQALLSCAEKLNGLRSVYWG